MDDTTPEMRKKQLEIVMRMTPQQRFEEGMRMIEFTRKVVENSILQKKPNLSATELKIEVFKRYYGKEFSEEQLSRIFDYFRHKKHPT
ncbi:hypothetical protein [Rhodoflexus sp.]